MSEIAAVLHKEARELFNPKGGSRNLVGQMVAFALLAMFFVRELGAEFGASWITGVFVSFVAGIAVLPVGADTFAGERDQRTLETLLASPVSPPGLVLGKFLGPALLGWLVGIVVLGAGLAARSFLPDATAATRAPVIAAALLFALLTAGLVSAVGIHVSLRAPNVKQATQTFGLVVIGAMILPPALLGWLGSESVGLWQGGLPLDATGDWVLAGIALLLVDAALVWLAIRRCDRANLVLD